jgi:NAD(P)-dependent dehydrogenase (short-subunit alcohol dehydrogenase family)
MSRNTVGTLEGGVCLVTGATAGLGRATAQELARQGAHVVLAARDRTRGEAARDAIRRATGNDAVEVLEVDLASLASVRAAAGRFLERHDRLHALISDAAVFAGARRETPEGFELMFATNYLGPFLLTNLLLGTLRASTPARILIVTAPPYGRRLDFDDLQSVRDFRPARAFEISKLCDLLFAGELGRRLEGSGVTANGYYPGLMRTGLMREGPVMYRLSLSVLGAAPRTAARKLVDALTSPRVAHLNGVLLKGDAQHETSPYLRNSRIQRQLWDATVPLVGL